jgi:hypothetical protein
MNEPRPVFRYLLIVAVVIYVVGVCLIQTDLYWKVGSLEHSAMHAENEPCGHEGAHAAHD